MNEMRKKRKDRYVGDAMLGYGINMSAGSATAFIIMGITGQIGNLAIILAIVAFGILTPLMASYVFEKRSRY